MNAIKSVRALAVMAALSALTSVASAQTLLTNAPVDVKVTLTSQCRWASGSAPTNLTVDFGSYTAFQAEDKAGNSTSLSLLCTRSFGTKPTITWDADDATESAQGDGVIAGLYYKLSLTDAGGSDGEDPTATGGATSGKPRTVSFTLSGNMPGGQAGTDAKNAQVTHARRLTLSF